MGLENELIKMNSVEDQKSGKIAQKYASVINFFKYDLPSMYSRAKIHIKDKISEKITDYKTKEYTSKQLSKYLGMPEDKIKELKSSAK